MISTPKRPLLRYFGGKWLLAPRIVQCFPPHRCYVEPYGGAASVLLRKPRSYAEVYNELNSEITDLFQVVRDRRSELIPLLKLTPYSAEEFKRSYAPSDDKLEQARRTLVRFWFGRGGDRAHELSGFRRDTRRKGGTPTRNWLQFPDALDSITERLRGVTIENRNALDVMQSHDAPDTLHYVDPPYVLDARNNRMYYKYEMTDEDHCALASVLHALKGSVVLSGYNTPLYAKLYAGWSSVFARGQADGCGRRTEVLWLRQSH